MISQEVAKLIQDFLGRPGNDSESATESFLTLAGSWADERPAKEIAKELTRARRSGRRFRGGDLFA